MTSVSKGNNNEVDDPDACTCDPCECDLPGTHAARMPPGYCTCDPCECDEPPLSGEVPTEDEVEGLSSEGDSGRRPRVATTTSSTGGQFSIIDCTCEPCECDIPGGGGAPKTGSSVDAPSTSSNESGMALLKLKGMPDGALRSQMECTCDPCLCDEPKQDAEWCEGPRQWTLPPTPEPSDHTFENLNAMRRKLCREFFPKNLGLQLSEDVIVDVLIKNPSGELELHLPGNQIHPGFLKQRICDDDIPVLVNVLLEIRGITKVNLCYNEISDQGMELLAPAIQECANIVDVDLMHNNLSSEGFLTLAKALMHRAPLQRLRLTGMKVGNEGINAMTCLVLSGRVPHDLDISECDMGAEGFQAFCSALAAMDSDVDYPNYLLLKNNLPMDLVELKDMKALYNDEVSQVSELNRKTSLPTIVRIIDHRDHHHHSHGPIVPYEDRSDGNNTNLFEVFENFSATILQGLFDLRHRFSEDDLTAQDIKLDSNPSAIPSAAPSIMLPEVDQLVENFHKIRAGEILMDPEEDGDAIESSMISRSLYSLEVVDEEVLLMDPVADTMDESDESDIDLTGIGHEHHHPPDVYTAEAAATYMVKEVVQTAAKAGGISEYRDRSDITQLVLMTVLETLEKLNSNTNLTEDDCHNILEDAMEKVYEFTFPRIPPDCTLSKDDIMIFFKVLFSASQGTFMKLFENPFVTQAIVEHGTKPCTEIIETARTKESRVRGKTGAMTEEQIYHIAASFLKGIILESARMVGVANPFGLEQDVNKDLVTTELKIEDTVDNLFDSAAALAVSARSRAAGLEETNIDFKKSADQFVMELFENVHKLISETNTKAAVEAKEELMGPSTYKYVSRPVRLVMNRPLFRENAIVMMAAKLGDYLSTNTTVTSLHITKWNLNEDGMTTLMDYILHRNFTLVVLDLACNQLGADGMKLLGIYITQNKNLKHLCLGNNRIKDAGMAFINQGLPDSSLISVDVANNGITAKELDHFLTIMPSTLVRACYLWGNKFGRTTWNIMRTLLDQGILNPGYTDIVLEKADEERMIVKNMQVRDVNEYYEVPAVQDKGLRLPPVFIDDSYKSPSRISSPVTSIFV